MAGGGNCQTKLEQVENWRISFNDADGGGGGKREQYKEGEQKGFLLTTRMPGGGNCQTKLEEVEKRDFFQRREWGAV